MSTALLAGHSSDDTRASGTTAVTMMALTEIDQSCSPKLTS
jgi:hypothetical protein